MNKFERIQAALKGEAVDRTPYSFWTHLPGIDLDPVKLADHTYDFYKAFDLDFVKSMANGMFSIEDFGCECDYSEIPQGGVAKLVKTAIRHPDDWDLVKPIDVTEGACGRELYSLRLLLNKLNGEVPVIATEFSPLTTADKMSGGKLLEHLKMHPEKIKRALDVIADAVIEHAREAVKLGCSGIFLASQMSSTDKTTVEIYKEFGVPYDKKIFQNLPGKAWFNVLHVHGNNIMFDVVKDYPVQAISWHVWETDPSVEDFVAKAHDKCIVGGLKRFDITNDQRDELAAEIKEMRQETNNKRLILAPGCVIRYPFNKATLDYLVSAIKK